AGDDQPAEVFRPHVAQRPPVRLADGDADAGYDKGFVDLHGVVGCSWSVVSCGCQLERLRKRTTDNRERSRRRSERATNDGLVPKGLVGRKDALDAGLRLLLAEEREEDLALEFQEVVLVDLGRAGESATAHHVGQLRGEEVVVRGDVVALLELR